eukprot:tig00000711_g3398.t1
MSAVSADPGFGAHAPTQPPGVWAVDSSQVAPLEPRFADASEAGVQFSVYAIPNRKDIANRGLVPIGAVFSPLQHLEAAPPVLRRAAARCEKRSCGAIVNPFCDTSSRRGAWRCCMCGHFNPNADEVDTYESCPEAHLATVDYLEPDAQPFSNASSYGTSHDADAAASGTHVFVLDATASPDDFQALRSSVERVLEALPQTARVALIVFNHVVSVYDLSPSPAVSAHCLSASRSPLPEDLKPLTDGCGMYVAPLHAALPIIRTVSDRPLRRLPPVPKRCRSFDDNFSVTLRVRHPTVSDFLSCSADPPALDAVASDRTPSGSASARRGIGPAVEVALALIQAVGGGPDLQYRAGGGGLASAQGGRVIVCAAGPATLGPGAVSEDGADGAGRAAGWSLLGRHSSATAEQEEAAVAEEAAGYFRGLSLQARETQATVDLYVASLRAVRGPVLAELPASCGGAFLLLSDFGARFESNLLRSFDTAVGRDASIDVRCSAALAVDRLMGPGVPAPSPALAGAASPSAAAAAAAGRDGEVALAGAHRRHCFGVTFRLVDDVPEDHVHFQFLVRYTDHRNARVLRVTTRRVATTGSLPSFLASADPDAVAYLLARQFLLLARRSGSAAARAALDAHLRALLLEYGEPPRRPASPELLPPPRLLPAPLEGLPRRLFLLREGPLLGPVLQHEDEVAAARHAFHLAPFRHALLLVAPRLLSATPAPAAGDGSQLAVHVEEVPPEAPAMRSDAVLLLDAFSPLLLWSGELVAGPEHDPLRLELLKTAAALAAQRYPTPEQHIFREGSSPARLLSARLVPSHKDSPAEQAADFPALRALPEHARVALQAKLQSLATDAPSFRQHLAALLAPR